MTVNMDWVKAEALRINADLDHKETEEILMTEARRDRLAEIVWRTFIGEQSFTWHGRADQQFLDDIGARFGEVFEVYQGKFWSNGVVAVGDTGLVHHAWCVIRDHDRKESIRLAIDRGLMVPEYVFEYLNL